MSVYRSCCRADRHSRKPGEEVGCKASDTAANTEEETSTEGVTAEELGDAAENAEVAPDRETKNDPSVQLLEILNLRKLAEAKGSRDYQCTHM